ncbi:hypothetical protein M9H77_19628 [Catharanthus roseus]|uniref:Uncharacterized protein n=1 Tax=Catharanthus roseus TaxID=4058 RepID=A0ACC0BAX8_CATRO|nr:hypothetical protein M9H77_19628 [Catharanthus roseus]
MASSFNIGLVLCLILALSLPSLLQATRLQQVQAETSSNAHELDHTKTNPFVGIFPHGQRWYCHKFLPPIFGWCKTPAPAPYIPTSPNPPPVSALQTPPLASKANNTPPSI